MRILSGRAGGAGSSWTTRTSENDGLVPGSLRTSACTTHRPGCGGTIHLPWGLVLMPEDNSVGPALPSPMVGTLIHRQACSLRACFRECAHDVQPDQSAPGLSANNVISPISLTFKYHLPPVSASALRDNGGGFSQQPSHGCCSCQRSGRNSARRPLVAQHTATPPGPSLSARTVARSARCSSTGTVSEFFSETS